MVAVTTRRALLLSTGTGWLLGQLGAGPAPLRGETVGASHQVGHLLRGAPPRWPETRRDACDVAVVGGGVAGLSAAWRLGGAGLDVRVLELEPFVGGTSTWSEDGTVPHPWGAHYLPAPNPEARPTLRLLEQMRVVTGYDPRGLPRFDPRVLCHAPEERVHYRGAWHPGLVPMDALDEGERAELRRFVDQTEALTEARGSDGRFAFQIPLDESSRDPDFLDLDRITMAAWLDREGYVTPFVRWYVRYATLDDFGAEPADVSAWAGLHYFAARKLKTPELEGSHFLVWPEGNGRLVRELLARSGAAVEKGALAAGVTTTERGVEISVLDPERQEARVVAARGAVLATPAFVGRRLFPSGRFPERASSPWLVANLHVDRPIDPTSAWDSVVYGGAGLGYVDASHQLTPPTRQTVLTYFRAFGDADVVSTRRRLEAATWEGLAASVFHDLAEPHPDLRRRTSRIDVVVWGHAMPRPRLGFLGQTPFEPEQRLARRLTWAHADVSGMALFEESQRAGVRAAELLAGDLGVDLGESWL